MASPSSTPFPVWRSMCIRAAPSCPSPRVVCRSAVPSHGGAHGVEAANAVDIPVCGVGGVMTGEDAAEFILAGACCVSVGMASFVEPDASVRILRELEEWAESQGV